MGLAAEAQADREGILPAHCRREASGLGGWRAGCADAVCSPQLAQAAETSCPAAAHVMLPVCARPDCSVGEEEGAGPSLLELQLLEVDRT